MRSKMVAASGATGDLHIPSHTSSCPGCVQGGSSDSLHLCQCIGFKKKIGEGLRKMNKKYDAHREKVHSPNMLLVQTISSHPFSGTFFGQSW